MSKIILGSNAPFKAADMEKILFDIKAENDDISSSSESYSNSIVSVTNL